VAVLVAGTHVLAYAQEVTGQDSVRVKKDGPVHSPRKATLYSAVLPGLGQIYNKKYWKVPIVYGGFIGFAVAIDWNNDQYILYKQAHTDISDTDPKTNSHLEIEAVKFYNMNNAGDVREFADKLKQAKDGARRYRDMNIIFTAAFYALNIIDASVDAHFFNFDISDDLSMMWVPETIYCLDQKMIGFNCRIIF
jgi:hypothetical protein